MLSPSRPLCHALLVSFIAVAGCASSPGTTPVPQLDAGHGTPDTADGHDAPALQDAHADGEADAGDSGGTDAVATRNAACTPLPDQTGTAVNTSHGRLDGTLVYVVDVGETQKICNGDDSHVHLQIEVNGAVYDVAVDIGTAPNDEVGSYEESIAVPGGVWAEGWHGADNLGYPSLGVHDTSFVTMAPAAMAAEVQSLLAGTSKISIFCTGYSQGNGCHDVHYKDGTTEDGAIVLDPTATTSKVLFFRFATQSF
jgi:hypothetical protein